MVEFSWRPIRDEGGGSRRPTGDVGAGAGAGGRVVDVIVSAIATAASNAIAGDVVGSSNARQKPSPEISSIGDTELPSKP